MPLTEGTDEYYQASYDADTLVRAEEIKADATRRRNALEILERRKDAVEAASEAAEGED